MPRFLRHCLFAIPCLLLALAGAARAGGEAYALDPVHTRILVAVDHAGFSKALGTVSGATGTLHFDPDDWSTARVAVEIPLARLDFGDADWNRATLARSLLDADAHPLARFTSTRVEPVDERRAIVHGTLSLRGVSREVALHVALNAAKRHPLPPFRRTVGFSATATLSRADFGITAWKSVIGDAVELRIEAEATRMRAGAEAEASDGDASPADAAIPTGPVPDPVDVPDPEPASESSPPPDPEPLP
ncbi:YceI family protein [Luteimonas marina]|uniref:YceI family protein n=1 Tax=Luteimonas marina TaxID=488485 RepID=A0A5C5U5G2_9GAMM|nr:YceI family protein [Luteimonas marina]TWT21186.1 YceI family protein [Luteimonas marina]